MDSASAKDFSEKRSEGVVSDSPSKGSSATKSVFLVPFPKIVFLYPTLLTALISALWLTAFDWFNADTGEPSRSAVICSAIFLVVTALNIVVLAFDFPRATSLTLFFLLAAVLLGSVLVFTIYPDTLPFLKNWIGEFRPAANPTFFWCISIVLLLIFGLVFLGTNFDYWEVKQNELLHHHGLLSDLKRYSAPSLRIDKEIGDVFEFVLLGSGRLILQPSGERKAIVLDNVLFINRKEAALTRLLSSLSVEVRGQESAT
jgi:hypothetical protein